MSSMIQPPKLRVPLQAGRLCKLSGVTSQPYAIATLTTPAVDESAMSARAVISTPCVDRVGDIMRPEGIDLTLYARNPIVLFEHGLGRIQTPVAKSEHPNGQLAIDVFSDRVEGVAYHTNRDRNSAQIFELVASGLIRAASIRAGDDTKSKMTRIDGKAVNVCTWWPLIEWSWCMIGANAECVRKTLDFGRLAESPISPALAKALEPHAAVARSERKSRPPEWERADESDWLSQAMDRLERHTSRVPDPSHIPRAATTELQAVESEIEKHVDPPEVDALLRSQRKHGRKALSMLANLPSSERSVAANYVALNRLHHQRKRLVKQLSDEAYVNEVYRSIFGDS